MTEIIEQHTQLPDTPAWVADAVFYQIFPDRFARSGRVAKPDRLEDWDAPPTYHGFKGGDLLGVVERLDHLQALGVNAIYFNPIFASASNHRYHTFDYFQVDPLLGGNAALRELLDAAHGRGMHVILDGVFNHASRGFWPFHHILENGSQSPYLDWFIINGFPLNAYHHDEEPNYAAWWNLPALPKLNVANPPTSAYLLDVAEYWIRFGADGWRLDVPQEIDDPDFWRSFRQRVRAANPDAYIVGEIWHEAPEWLQGDRCDALMNYPLAMTALCFLAADTLQTHYAPGGYQLQPLSAADALARLNHLQTCYDPNIIRSQFNLLESHDTPRFLTMAGGDASALHLATLLQMTLPGAPSIYYGSEVGLAGGADPDCRRGFPWQQERWNINTWELTRAAIALRNAHRGFRHGRFVPVFGGAGVLAYALVEAETTLLVAMNAGRETQTVELTLPAGTRASARVTELWRVSDNARPVEWRRKVTDAGEELLVLNVELPARGARIWRIAE